MSVYVIFHCQHIEDGNEKLADEQTVEVSLDACGWYQAEYKNEPDSQGGHIKQKCDAGFSQTVENAGQCTGQVKEWADKAEREDKRTCHFTVEQKDSGIPAGQQEAYCA